MNPRRGVSVRQGMRTLALPVLSLGLAVLAGAGCRMNIDTQAFIERDEKRFATAGPVDLDLSTFDGSIEIRSWDRTDALVAIEKRGQDKAAVDRIAVIAGQTGRTVSVHVQHDGPTTVIGIGRVLSTRARLVVTAPRAANVVARTGDGAITLERIDGRVDLRTGDGRITVVDVRGDVLAESGDGSLTLDGVSGRVEARTGDGSVRVSGTPGVLRIRTGDGAVSLRIRHGAAMTDDWTIDTGEGPITAELPSGFNAMIEADPGADGRVRNELDLVHVSGPGAGQTARGLLTGQLGRGGKRLTLRTGDGTIRLTRY